MKLYTIELGGYFFRAHSKCPNKLVPTLFIGCFSLFSITFHNAHMVEGIREERVSTHLLIYSFLFFKLSLEVFWLDFELRLGLTLELELGLEFGLGLELGLGLE